MKQAFYDLVLEMKQNKVDYEDRITELEKIEHPKPLRDFIYNTYNKFLLDHHGLEKII